MSNDIRSKDRSLSPGMCEYESKGDYLPVNEEHQAQIDAGERSAADGHREILSTTKAYECTYVCKDDNGDLVLTTGVSTDTFLVDHNNAAVCEGVTITTEDNPYNISKPLPVPHSRQVSRSSINEVGPVRVVISRAAQRAADSGDVSEVVKLSTELFVAATQSERRELFGVLLAHPDANGALGTAERLLNAAADPEETGHLVRNAGAQHASVLLDWVVQSDVVAQAHARGEVLAKHGAVAMLFGQVLSKAATSPDALAASDILSFVAVERDYAAARSLIDEAGGYPKDALSALLAKIEQVRPDLAAPLRELVRP